jgi:hypothetical protein
MRLAAFAETRSEPGLRFDCYLGVFGTDTFPGIAPFFPGTGLLRTQEHAGSVRSQEGRPHIYPVLAPENLYIPGNITTGICIQCTGSGPNINAGRFFLSRQSDTRTAAIILALIMGQYQIMLHSRDRTLPSCCSTGFRIKPPSDRAAGAKPQFLASNLACGRKTATRFQPGCGRQGFLGNCRPLARAPCFTE